MFSGLTLKPKIGYHLNNNNDFCDLMKLMEIPKEVYLDKLKTERVLGLLKK